MKMYLSNTLVFDIWKAPFIQDTMKAECKAILLPYHQRAHAHTEQHVQAAMGWTLHLEPSCVVQEPVCTNEKMWKEQSVARETKHRGNNAIPTRKAAHLEGLAFW